MSTERGEKAAGEGRHARPPRPLRLRINTWLRWLHIYISMFSLLVILFFSVTGITLNHPEWSFNNIQTQSDLSGTLPAGWKTGKQIDWLKVVEYLRSKHHVRGAVEEHNAESDEGTVSFKGPGYAADCFFQLDTGQYKLTIIRQGMAGVLNDFHRGANAGRSWAWAIDVSGLFLTLISLTGLGLLLYLKKVRAKALITLAAGAILVFLLMKLVA